MKHAKKKNGYTSTKRLASLQIAAYARGVKAGKASAEVAVANNLALAAAQRKGLAEDCLRNLAGTVRVLAETANTIGVYLTDVQN